MTAANTPVMAGPNAVITTQLMAVEYIKPVNWTPLFTTVPNSPIKNSVGNCRNAGKQWRPSRYPESSSSRQLNTANRSMVTTKGEISLNTFLAATALPPQSSAVNVSRTIILVGLSLFIFSM